MSDSPYTSHFFDGIRDGSRRSAEAIVPIVLGLARPKSVVDVGCGDGTWLSVFREFGVDDTFGLDGDYVNRQTLRIPQDRFRPTDLTSPFELGRSFDLAVSLEVAEHLPPQSAKSFVDSLAKLAPVVLFSAAIPLQGGTQHLNEQWPEYWAALFKAHDYLPIDCIRGKVWTDERVAWYYAQNAMLFARTDRLAMDPDLRREQENTNLKQLALVHPTRFLQPSECGVWDALRLLANAAKNAALRRLRATPRDNR